MATHHTAYVLGLSLLSVGCGISTPPLDQRDSGADTAPKPIQATLMLCATDAFYCEYYDAPSATAPRARVQAAEDFGPLATPLVGDWDGDGVDELAYYSLGVWYFLNPDGTTRSTTVFGGIYDAPLACDFNGDGTDSIGVYEPATGRFRLKNDTTAESPVAFDFNFGPTPDASLAPIYHALYRPLCGDWDGDGTDSVAVYNSLDATFALRNSNSSGSADTSYNVGVAGKTLPGVGDLDGDGIDNLMLFHVDTRELSIYDQNRAGPANQTIVIARPYKWLPLAGVFNAENVPQLAPAPSIAEATASSVGLDQSKIDDAISTFSEVENLRSLLILKNGRLISETYFDQTNRNMRQEIASVSKSVTALLWGIAYTKGLFTDDPKMIDLLPSAFANVSDPRKLNWKLSDFLTMRTGSAFQNRDVKSNSDYTFAADPAQYLAQVPLESDPGTSFKYLNPVTQLAGFALESLTGVPLHEYAKTHLFPQIGIQTSSWTKNFTNQHVASCCLQITPRDMALIGELFRNYGKNHLGEQIIAPDWIMLSEAEFSSWGAGQGYGLQWWTDTNSGHKMVMAKGWGGQLIVIIRDLNLTIVTTSLQSVDGATSDTVLGTLVSLIKATVIPAVIAP